MIVRAQQVATLMPPAEFYVMFTSHADFILLQQLRLPHLIQHLMWCCCCCCPAGITCSAGPGMHAANNSKGSSWLQHFSCTSNDSLAAAQLIGMLQQPLKLA
jgi:hypothetical protein